MSAKTLLDFAGVSLPTARFEDAVLLLIDHQQEYSAGKLKLPGIEPAVEAIGRLQDAARKAGAPIVHVAQNGRPGSALFDPEGPMSRFIAEIAPAANEATVIKSLPNAFAKTDLDA